MYTVLAMNPYRVPGRVRAKPAPSADGDDGIVAMVMVVVGAVPVIGTVAVGAPIGGEATAGLLLVVLGALGAWSDRAGPRR
ncbi:MAG: hypothetical protein R2939_17155 [Kofleriaceae bacterium]